MKEMDKKNIVLLVVAFILVSVIGVAFAYFQNQIGDGANVDVHANADTVDSLVFIPGKEINIKATQENFAQGLKNREGETTLTAILKANSTTKQAHYTYNVYLDIYNNNFEYTQGTGTAELLLQVTGPTGEIKDIDGLEWTTSGGIEGFDITTKQGPIEIILNQKIDATEETNGEATQEWTFKVIFVNLEANQNGNSGKELNARLTIQSEKRNYAKLDISKAQTIDEYYYQTQCLPADDPEECKNKMNTAKDEDYNDYRGSSCYYSDIGEYLPEKECYKDFVEAVMIYYNETGETYRSDEYRDKIQNIKFVNYIDENYKEKTYWDLSTNQDESIIGWLETKLIEECVPNEYTDCKLYELYIGSEETIYIDNLSYAFANMGSLESIDFGKDVIDTSLVADMSGMLYFRLENYIDLLELKGIENIDTSNVTNMSHMFYGNNIYDIDSLSSWDTSHVTNMSSMFGRTYITDISPISNWDTSNVTDMSDMFYWTRITDISTLKGWNTSNVTNMARMFSGCSNLITMDLSGWNTSKVIDMSGIFTSTGITDINSLGNWDTSHVTDMNSMFEYTNITDLSSISNWNTSKVADMSNMFSNCFNITTADLSGWNTSRVTDMSYMFSETSISDINPISNWNTSRVTDMSNMFLFADFTDLSPLKDWDVSNVTDMSDMFSWSEITDLSPIKSWKTSNVTNMNGMFYHCLNLRTADLGTWNTTKVTDMSDMFSDCITLISADLSGWDTSNVTNMRYMFADAGLLTDLKINNFSFNIVNSSDYYNMFDGHNFELKITTNSEAKAWLTAHKEEIELTIDNDLIIVPE